MTNRIDGADLKATGSPVFDGIAQPNGCIEPRLYRYLNEFKQEEASHAAL